MNATQFRSMLKKNSLVFFTYKKLTDSLYRSNFIDYLFKDHVKSRETIKKELNLIKNYWKCDPMSYYRYRLYEKDLTTDELLDYIPPYYFYNFYVPSVYDDSWISKAASKIFMNDYFKSRDIETPRVLAIVTGSKIFSEGELIGYDRFLEKLLKTTSASFFMKPENGKGGKGIYRIEKVGTEVFINNDFLTRDLFSEIISTQNYIIQEGVIQRDDFMKLYPESVNTLRVITQNFNGNARISAATIRMGRNGTFVDNSASGGISAGIDLETGTIARYAVDLDNNKMFDRHPDSGFLFEGFVIRDWARIRHRILELAQTATEFPDAGWDIAVVDGGIIVIELNLNYGIDLQGVIGGMRRMLNIEPFNFQGILKKYNH